MNGKCEIFRPCGCRSARRCVPFRIDGAADEGEAAREGRPVEISHIPYAIDEFQFPLLNAGR